MKSLSKEDMKVDEDPDYGLGQASLIEHVSVLVTHCTNMLSLLIMLPIRAAS